MVTCDTCKKEFTINLREYKHPFEKIKGYVAETYFTCPHCRKKYISYATDKVIRKKQKEIKEYHRQIFKKVYSGLTAEEFKSLIDQQYAELNKMKICLKEQMDKLKELVIKHWEENEQD